MKTTAEIEIRVSGAKVTDAVIMHDGICKITIEMVNAVSKVTEAENDDMFVLVDASKLSLNEEHEFRCLLVKAIKSGLKDFKRPKCDPSFNKGGICYEYGKDPAISKSYDWWNKVAKEFKPEHNSRLGTKTEYIAFLGVLIKRLVEMGWPVKEAWNAVCNDSRKLGNYWNSEDTKHDFEPTGSREICGFYDLANCRKILEKEINGDFWIAGAEFTSISNFSPLALIFHTKYKLERNYLSVGWIVLD